MWEDDRSWSVALPAGSLRLANDPPTKTRFPMVSGSCGRVKARQQIGTFFDMLPFPEKKLFDAYLKLNILLKYQIQQKVNALNSLATI